MRGRLDAAMSAVETSSAFDVRCLEFDLVLDQSNCFDFCSERDNKQKRSHLPDCSYIYLKAHIVGVSIGLKDDLELALRRREFAA